MIARLDKREKTILASVAGGGKVNLTALISPRDAPSFPALRQKQAGGGTLIGGGGESSRGQQGGGARILDVINEKVERELDDLLHQDEGFHQREGGESDSGSEGSGVTRRRRQGDEKNGGRLDDDEVDGGRR